MTLQDLLQAKKGYEDNPEWAKTLPKVYIILVNERIEAERKKQEEHDPKLQRKIDGWIQQGRINTTAFEEQTDDEP